MALPAPRRGASYSAFNFNYIIISINCIIRSDEIGGNDNRKKENRDRRAGGAGPSSGRCYYRKRCAIGGATEDFTVEFVATAAGLQTYEQLHLSDAAADHAADHTADCAGHAADHTGDARRIFRGGGAGREYRRRRYISGHRADAEHSCDRDDRDDWDDRDDHYH